MPRLVRLCVVGTLVLASVACRQDMHDQAKLEPLEFSPVFPGGGGGSRPLPPHTVPRGFLEEDRALHTGLAEDGGWVAELPIELDAALLERGRERYEIYCSPCHDRTGAGRGMIVQRGFTQPPPYWDERLLGMPIGYFFDVATNGFGQMSGYASQVPVHDRWAIAAWVRVLQRARTMDASRLAQQERDWVDEGRSLAEDAAGGGAHGEADAESGAEADEGRPGAPGEPGEQR